MSRMRHQCQLEERSDPCFPRLPPYASWRIKLKNAIKRNVIISRQHYNTRQLFRSEASVKKEIERHITLYRTIHPFSNFCWYRNIFICIIWTLAFLNDPFIVAFNNPSKENHTRDHMDYLKYIVDSILLLDIPLNFFIGYYSYRMKIIVLSWTKIFGHYVCTYFIFDFLGSVPFFLIYMNLLNSIELKTICSILPMLRIFRLLTLLCHLNDYLTMCNIRDTIAKCICISILTFFIIHFMTCILYLIPAYAYILRNDIVADSFTVAENITYAASHPTTIYKYLKCSVIVICHFFGAGVANVTVTNRYEMMMLTFIVLFGFVYYVAVIAVLLHIFGFADFSENEYESQFNELNAYMKSKKLPQVLKDRLKVYYEFKFQKRTVFEEKELSPHLRREILLYNYNEFTKKVRAFQGVPPSVLEKIINYLKQEFYLASDVIIEPTTHVTMFYFISSGTVAVTYENTELYHLEDGDQFGDTSIILQARGAIAPAILAIETTEIFTIEKKVLYKFLKPFPDLIRNMEEKAMKRVDSIIARKFRYAESNF